MLFVDRDELLFCPSASLGSNLSLTPPPSQPGTIFQSNLIRQGVYQKEYIQEMLSARLNRSSLPLLPSLTRPQASVSLGSCTHRRPETVCLISFRQEVAPSLPTETRDDLNYLNTKSCVESVYHPTATTRLNLATTGSLTTVREMLRCFGGNLVGERKRYSRKCLELSVGGICPFNGVHVLCQRCKCLERRPSAERSVSVCLSLSSAAHPKLQVSSYSLQLDRTEIPLSFSPARGRSRPLSPS
jgi:hypothetical protein